MRASDGLALSIPLTSKDSLKEKASIDIDKS